MTRSLGRGLFVLLSGALPMLPGCHTGAADKGAADTAPWADATPPRAAPRAPPPLRNRPRTDHELPTTTSSIFLSNMDGQIESVTKRVHDLPNDASSWRMLGGFHVTRGKHRGDLDEIQLAIDEYDKAIALGPTDPASYLARASAEQSLHRFGQAEADVEKAKSLGAKPEDWVGLQQELDWNDGKYDAAIAAIHAAVATQRTAMSVAREAQLHHDLGEEEACDREFEEAEDLIRDVNPIPVAWLDVQRGMHKEHIGQYETAALFFREAVTRIPTFVMAIEHLAELLHWMGQDEEATRLYEDLVSRSTDPEFMGALAAIYRVHGRLKEADALHARATARYGELLAKYPDAMYWHASEYFMGEGGDPKRALDLLTKNLALRPNSTSYVALARAELANDRTAEAKASIEKALAMPLVSAELFWTAARVYARTGDNAKRDAFKAKALAFNPHVGETEPAITTPAE